MMIITLIKMKFYTYVKKYKYEKEKLNHMLFYMYDLIIVGGGISGLYLYYKLIHKNKKERSFNFILYVIKKYRKIS